MRVDNSKEHNALNDLDLNGPPSEIRAAIERILDEQQRAFLEQIESLKSQLEWFKRQLFGEKSERFPLEADSRQLPIPWEVHPEGADQKVATQPVRAHERRSKRPPEEDGVGLRFDETVPVETIEIIPPELSGKDADQYEILGTKETHRLARKPGSYFVLRYVRTVIKRKSDEKIITPPPPEDVR